MRHVAAIGALALLGAASTGTTADAKVIATTVDSGSYVSASAYDFLIEDPASLGVDVIASPSATVEVRISVSCSRNTNRRSYDRTFTVSDPLHRRVNLPISRPDDCSLDATAEYADFEQSGRIAVKLRATFRR